MVKSLDRLVKILFTPFTFAYKALIKLNVSKNLSILIIGALTFFLIVLVYLIGSTVFAQISAANTSDQRSSSRSVVQIDAKTQSAPLPAERQAQLLEAAKNRIPYNLVSEKSLDKDSSEYSITISPKNKNIDDLKKLGAQLKNEISRKPNDTVFIFTNKQFADLKGKEKELSKAQTTEYYKNFVAVYTRNISAGINQISINLDGDPRVPKGSEIVSL